jgi:uncharacterized protein YndB with AHSA1/START domain
MTAKTHSGSATVTLPTDTQILIVREFDAPKHLVYRAYTEPDLIKRWWSGRRGEVTSAEVDLRVGGTWRYVMVANDGSEVAFHGRFREVLHDERLVTTEIFEGAPVEDEERDGALDTVKFEEAGGRTTLTTLMELPSREVRDMILETGMEDGMQEAFDRLEEVAASLA